MESTLDGHGRHGHPLARAHHIRLR
jgi:hypothetical protein